MQRRAARRLEAETATGAAAVLKAAAAAAGTAAEALVARPRPRRLLRARSRSRPRPPRSRCSFDGACMMGKARRNRPRWRKSPRLWRRRWQQWRRQQLQRRRRTRGPPPRARYAFTDSNRVAVSQTHCTAGAVAAAAAAAVAAAAAAAEAGTAISELCCPGARAREFSFIFWERCDGITHHLQITCDLRCAERCRRCPVARVDPLTVLPPANLRCPRGAHNLRDVDVRLRGERAEPVRVAVEGENELGRAGI